MREMKDSGIEWLGDIPKTWNAICHKRFMTKVKDICEKWNHEDVISLTVNGVVKRDLEKPKGKMPATFDGYQFVYPGNLLLCLFDIDVTPRCAGKVDDYGVTSPAYSQYALREGFDVGYYSYYFIALDNQKLLLHLTPTMRSSFNADEFAKIFAIAPPFSEQVEIAKYLDTQCEKIDSAIEAAEKSIEEYKAYKQSVIFEAVTKGLDTRAPMKDSGIEWLGEIPAHWEILPFKHCYVLVKRDYQSDAQLLSVYLNQGVIPYNQSDGRQVHKPSESLEKYQYVLPNDLVLNNQQAWRGSVGVSEWEGIISPAYHVFKPSSNNLLPQYANCLFRIALVPQFDLVSRGVGTIQRCISVPDFLNTAVVVVPPMKEQEAICRQIELKIEAINSAVVSKQSIIEDLKAYKKSLIYEVVTGKREINDC